MRFKLGGRRIDWIDVHLLASAGQAGRASLFMCDKRLATVADKLGLSYGKRFH